MRIRIAEQGGVFKEIEVGNDATVGQCLNEAGVNTGREKEIRLNTEPATSDTIVEDGDIIHVTPNIEGGC